MGINRTQRAKIANETLKILNEGFYYTTKGKVVIRNLIDYATSNTILYTTQKFIQTSSHLNELLDRKDTTLKTHFEVLNETTLSTANRLITKQNNRNVLCLNFASAKNPGGGFLKGSLAQEESLAIASGLYVCIAQINEYYKANKSFRSALHTDNMIYSPRIPVFREDTHNLISCPYPLSIITAPAVNAGAVKRNEPQNISKIEKIMRDRIEKVLSISLIHGHDVLILGAWGCGVFKNSPNDLAQYFYDHLRANGKFHNAFKRIIFAILDKSKEKKIIQPFENLFLK